MAKAPFSMKKTLSISKLNLNVRNKVVALSVPFYGAETSTLQKVDQKCFESRATETWSWRRMEKIRWNERVRNEVKEERDILYRMKRR